MADDKTDAENKASAEEIARMEQTEHGARGNKHSEPDYSPADQDGPPPMPH